MRWKDQNRKKGYSSYQGRYKWPKEISLQEAIYTVNKAFDILNNCVNDRWNLKYCRKVGRVFGKKRTVFDNLIFYGVKDDYFVKNSDVSIYIDVVYEDILGATAFLYIVNHKSGFVIEETICDPARCDCNVLYDG